MSTQSRVTPVFASLPGSVRIRVRLIPKSSRDAVEGEETLSDGGTVLSVRVRALPENGRANAALEALLAKAAGVARTRVSVVSGATSRIKTVEIQGEPSAINARLRSPNEIGPFQEKP